MGVAADPRQVVDAVPAGAVVWGPTSQPHLEGEGEKRMAVGKARGTCPYEIWPYTWRANHTLIDLAVH